MLLYWRTVAAALAGGATLAGCWVSESDQHTLEVVVSAKFEVPRSRHGSVALLRTGGDNGPFLLARRGGDAVLRIDSALSQLFVTPSDSIVVSELGVDGGLAWVADAAAQRVLTSAERSGGVREIRFPTIMPRAESQVLGMLKGDRVVVATRPELSRQDTVVSVLAFLVAGNATVVDSLLATNPAMWIEASDGEPPMVIGQPFHYRDMAVISSDGNALVVLRQRTNEYAHGQVRVDIHGPRLPDGPTSARTLRVRAVAITPRLVTSWLRNALSDSLVAGRFGRAKAERRLRDALYVPRYLPPFRRALASTADSLLLQRTTVDGRHHWELWHLERRVGSFLLDANVVLQQFVGSTVWAIARSADGSEAVVALSLRERRR
jgi:hypothetical protein